MTSKWKLGGSRMNPTKGVPPLLVKTTDPGRSPDRCAWFLGCQEPATVDVEHPTLGWVPVCQSHLDWLSDDR